MSCSPSSATTTNSAPHHCYSEADAKKEIAALKKRKTLECQRLDAEVEVKKKLIRKETNEKIEIIEKNTVKAVNNRPDFTFPIEWSYTFHDLEEMNEMRETLRWCDMRDRYGWSMITGETYSSIFLRPDVDSARRQSLITRNDIFRKGTQGVHYFNIKDDAKAYFKSCFRYKPLPIDVATLSYIQSIINTTSKIDTCSICTEDLEELSTTVTLPCKHTYCYECVLHLIRSTKERDVVLNCPNCRQPLTREVVMNHKNGSGKTSQ